MCPGDICAGKQDLKNYQNFHLQIRTILFCKETQPKRSYVLSGVLIYDNLLLKGTQIQSWWLVPLNCAPPYNNADIVCSGQLALPDVRLASVGEDARVPVGHLTVPRRQVGVAVLVHLHHRLLLRVSLGASEGDGLPMDQYLQLHDI